MKHRILFVDDEPLILQGLQRMLRSMRAEWDMEFVESGAAALKRLAQAPFDVVVTDMRMPGMNGAELLHQVMKLYPLTVRLVLSGHADKDLVLKCVGTAHQYLSKPCDPDSLKAAVERVSTLGTSLQNESVKKLVGQMDRLPSLPSLYVDIIEKLQNPETVIRDIAKIIARDIGMTAKLLKLVNSAFFGLSQRVADLNEAVAYLGLNTIRTLVLCLNTFSQYEGLAMPGMSVDSLWWHSLETGSLAKRISLMEEAGRQQVEESFVGGMLHDAGKIVLASNFRQEYARVLDLARTNSMEITTAEIQVFGSHHAAVGGYLLSLWGLPVPVVEAIAFHHQPAECSVRTYSALTAVHVANILTQPAGGLMEGIVGPRLDREYLAELGVAGRVEAWRQAPSETELNR